MTTDRCLLAGLLLIAAPLAAQQRQRETPPPGGQPRDFRLAEPRTFALDNGLAVTLVQYGDVPKTTVQLAVRSGNLNESASEVWLSDLTGDMMQEGTTTRSAAQVAEAAAGMGGQLSVNVGLDESSVAGDVLSEFAPDFVRLVADVARNPALPAAELPRLKANRVRNLSVQLRSPQSQTVARFRAAMYPDHPYGRVFPTADQINGYTAEQVRAFHAANWGAGRARLTIVGNFDDRAMETAIREAFGSWARGSDAVVNVPTPVARRDLLTVDRPTAPQSTLAIAIPVEDPSHADWIALLVTNTLLGGGFSSRITTNIREDKGYTYSPFSAVSARYRDAYHRPDRRFAARDLQGDRPAARGGPDGRRARGGAESDGGHVRAAELESRRDRGAARLRAAARAGPLVPDELRAQRVRRDPGRRAPDREAVPRSGADADHRDRRPQRDPGSVDAVSDDGALATATRCVRRGSGRRPRP
jgi:predicted Zn-dependent peptidase